MDEKKLTDGGTDEGGPLAHLVKEELVGVSDSAGVDEAPADSDGSTTIEDIRHRLTRVEPSTGDPDYSRGTSEPDDERGE